MKQNKTVEELIVAINELTPIEKRIVQQRLKENTVQKPVKEDKSVVIPASPRLCNDEADEMLWAINESKYYTTIAQPQIHDPVAIAGEQGKELPERYEPSHEDLDDIFGSFQSHQSVEELVEEIYRLRTVGTEREPLNQ